MDREMSLFGDDVSLPIRSCCSCRLWISRDMNTGVCPVLKANMEMMETSWDSGIDCKNFEPVEERTDNDLSDEELDAKYGVAKEDTTCFRCPISTECKYAWDPYNTDGDCLADK